MTQYPVDRDSPVPVYYQIASALRQRIADGEWRKGNQLPPEPELAKAFGVSRMTLRQALVELEGDNIIVRRRGAGTFVNQSFLDITEAAMPLPMGRSERPQSRKDELRLQVWAALREVARPDARFHWDFTQFVPDFQGSERCADAIRRHPLYRRASLIFVAPDNSLRKVRAQAMADGKRLLVATHAIARGFYLVDAGVVPEEQIPFAATLDGLEQHARLVDIEGVRALGAIDLLVTGISLVTEHGVRWGKGHGYFDLEWAMFRELGVANDDTPVMAVGHDCQIVDAELEPSPVDTIADLIITPTQVIEVQQVFDKPRGILWESVSPELLRQVPSLHALYATRSDKTT